MSELCFLTSSDEHVADLNPGYRKGSYRDEIMGKIQWQADFARKIGAKALLRAGDFIHMKAANKTTYSTISAAAQIHKGMSCPTFALKGNHDMSYNDPATINRQPLGTLLKSGVFQDLDDVDFVEGSMRVRMVGVDYTTDLDVLGLQEKVKKREGDTYTIAFVHALAAMAPDEKIQSFFNERIFDYRDLIFEGCPDVYVFGHYHKDQGVIDHLGTKFVNLGAVSRGALTFENLDRKPKSGIIRCNSQGIFVEEVVIPHKDSSEVFDLQKKKQLDTERKNLDGFIAQLRTTASMAEADGIEARKQMMEGFPDDLRALILETLEAAEAGTLDELRPLSLVQRKKNLLGLSQEIRIRLYFEASCGTG